MKVAIVRRRFAPTGGAEQYLQRLLPALGGAGHELHLLAEQWPGVPEGVRWHPLAVSGGRAARPERFAAAVEAELAREPFDCVLSLERTRRQDVYRAGDGVHRVWLQRRRQFAPWWRKPFLGRGAFHRNILRLEQSALDPRNTRRVIVNSEMVRHEIIRHFRFPADRIHLVRNGVATDRFRGASRDAGRARFGLPPESFVLLFAGSGWERKGLRFLLAAFARLRDPHAVLLVAGKGRRPVRPPPNVIFAGECLAVEDAYAAADLFVFLPIYEPCANACCEALAAGLPVITSGYNGAAELIEEGRTGSVIRNPADTDAVVRAIRTWRTVPRAPIPVRARNLDLDRNAAETLAVLELAARERRA